MAATNINPLSLLAFILILQAVQCFPGWYRNRDPQTQTLWFNRKADGTLLGVQKNIADVELKLQREATKRGCGPEVVTEASDRLDEVAETMEQCVNELKTSFETAITSGNFHARSEHVRRLVNCRREAKQETKLIERQFSVQISSTCK